MKKLLLLACFMGATSAFAYQQPEALKGRDLCILPVVNDISLDDGVDAGPIKDAITDAMIRRFTLSRVKFSLKAVPGCLVMYVYSSARKSKSGATLYFVELEALESYRPDAAPKNSPFIFRSVWSTASWGTGQDEAATVLPDQTKAVSETFLLDYISQNP